MDENGDMPLAVPERIVEYDDDDDVSLGLSVFRRWFQTESFEMTRVLREWVLIPHARLGSVDYKCCSVAFAVAGMALVLTYIRVEPVVRRASISVARRMSVSVNAMGSSVHHSVNAMGSSVHKSVNQGMNTFGKTVHSIQQRTA